MSIREEPPFPPGLAEVMQVCRACARGNDCDKHRFKGFPKDALGEHSSNPREDR